MLSVAFNEQDNNLLVVLSQKIVVSRNGKPRISYMFVPVESLSTEIGEPASWNLADGIVSLCTVDDCDARDDQSSRLVRASCSLAKESWVTMPL